MAPSATTYEALVQAMARSIRRINYSEYDERVGKEMMKICSHSSLAFSLQELGSLFRKHANDLVNFLQEAYDCTDEYTYVTKTQGKDRIRKCCLNMLAGTTPEFMQTTFNDGLLNQGFTSRAFFIYAQKNRKSVFFVPELTKEQTEARDKIKAHVKNLSTLYGQVKIDADTANFLQEWWTEFESNPQRRVNKSRKLEAYYSRMNIHVMKVAMAIHFGESLDMTIPRETFERAIDVLRKEEKTMHLALTMEAGNPLSDASSKILNYMRANGQKTFEELHVEFWDTVRREELTEILEFCQETHQVVTITETDEYTHETKLVYKLKM